MGAPNNMPLPPCRVVDHDRVVNLRIEPLWRIAADCKLRPAPAIAALLPPTCGDIEDFLSGRARQAVCRVEKGGLNRFLGDPEAHDDLQSGSPVVALFADETDYAQLISTLPVAPLSEWEQCRLEEARADAMIEVRDECDEDHWRGDDEEWRAAAALRGEDQ